MNVLHASRNFLLVAVVVAAAVDLMLIPVFGSLSDRIGRRRMYFIGALATAVYAAVYFPLLNTANPTIIFVAIVLSMVPHSMVDGPQAALIAERFTPRLRYSRRLARLPARLDRCRRSRSADRHSPFGDIRVRLCGRGLPSPLRVGQRRRRKVPA